MNRSKPQGSIRHRQRGLSLVELMIALVLGLVLSAGVFQVFTNSSQTYRLTDSLSNMQENLRFAVGRLQYETRMAGYKGCLIGQPFDNLDSTDAAYRPYAYGGRPVAGWEADGTDLGEAYTNTDFDPASTSLTEVGAAVFPVAGDVLPGSDVLVVNNASLLNVTLTGNPGASANTIVTAANSGIPAGRIILAVTSDCTGADLFQKTNSKDSVSLTKGGGQAPGNQTPVNDGFSATYDNGSTIYEFNSTAFFIRQGASGGPSLFMRRLDAGDPFGNVELVEGVENMQVLYGITNSGGQTVVNYVSADNIVSWANVASVRIALLLRSDDGIQDDGLADGEANVGQIYNLLGTQITTEADERARMVGTLTVGIRNRLE